MPLGWADLRSFELHRLPLRDWVQRRIEAFALPGAPPADFERWVPSAERAAGGVNYGIQRILYELAEEWARGAPDDEDTFAEAVRRAAPDLSPS